MRYVIIATRLFSIKARMLQLTLEDIRAIENDLMADPAGWPVIPGTHGLRKMRFAPERRAAGKSGGVRVCYFVLDENKHIHLVTVFAKSQQANLSAAERHTLGQVVAYIKTHSRKEP